MLKIKSSFCVKMSRATRKANLRCLLYNHGVVTAARASQILTDGRAIVQVFQDIKVLFNTIYCLAELGQLLL